MNTEIEEFAHPATMADVLDAETRAEIERIELEATRAHLRDQQGAELSKIAQLIIEVADAQKADREAKIKSRETGKVAKRKLEMLAEVLKPSVTQEEVTLPELVLSPVDPKLFTQVLTETSAFFTERARLNPHCGPELLRLWDYGRHRLRSFVDESRIACRDTRSVVFIIGDWRRDMYNGAWEITGWR